MTTVPSMSERSGATRRVTSHSAPLVPRWAIYTIVLLVALAGAGTYLSNKSDAPSVPTAYVVTALGRSVGIANGPGGATTRILANPDTYGQPLTFLMEERQGDFVKVALPVRPNGSSGWVKASQVRIQEDPYRLDVDITNHQVRVYDSGDLQDTYPIAVGRKETPTPGGTYYLRVLLKPPNPNGPYGPYAYGLNGFSPVLNSFNGGDGVIGLHGTNEPQVIGTDVSHGCIRLRNEDIAKLVPELPLGTPVRILA